MTADVAVLIATYQRAPEIRRTLERLVAAIPDDLAVEVVVVDNNSGDDTAAVVAGFTDAHPVTYMFEARQGKNCALNAALDAVDLGRLVVFIDDDIDVDARYFEEVRRAAEAHPESAVFGGRLRSLWPPGAPTWTKDPSLLGWGYPVLDLGDEPAPFPEGRFPAGGNFWVRSEVFADGLRFDESVGPRPRNRIMGSETSLLRALHERGHHPRYWPDAVVDHRLHPDELTPRAIRRRGFRNGRSSPHVWGLKQRELLARRPLLWRALRFGSLVRYALVAGVSFLHPDANRRTLKTVRAVRGIAFNLESLRVERRQRSERERND